MQKGKLNSYQVIVYMDNDGINSKEGEQALSEYANGSHLYFRNPAFYDFKSVDNELVGTVEKLGPKAAKPDLVIIRKGSPNEEIIADSYERARVKVEFVEFTVARPKGNIEQAPGGELLNFLRGLIDSKGNPTQAASGDGAQTGGEAGKGSGKASK